MSEPQAEAADDAALPPPAAAVEAAPGEATRPLAPESANEPLPADFGAQLRAAREAAGLSVPTLAMRLRLHVKQVEALERANLAALPSLIYVRGFLRSCARELKIDPLPLLADLDRRAGVPQGTPAAPPPSSMALFARFGDSSRPIIVLALLVLVVAGVVGVLLPRHHEPAAPVVVSPPPPSPAPAPAEEGAGTAAAPAPGSAPTGEAPRPAAAPVPGAAAAAPRAPLGAAARPSPTVAAPVPIAPPPPEPAPAPAPAAPVADADALVLHVRGSSWVEVAQANGATVFSQICLPGTATTIHGTPPLRLVIGNAAGVDAQFRGAPVDLQAHANANGVARLTLP
jgi:cytoskeleton protein RodZ